MAKLPQMPFSQAVLDSMSAHIAVLDRNGTILTVNTAWERFGRENGRVIDPALDQSDVGSNYLAACRAGANAGIADAQAAYDGIRDVLHGQRSSFMLEYRCNGPHTTAWYVLSATPLDTHGVVVVAHADMTAHRQAEADLEVSERRFQQLAESLPQLVWAGSPDGQCDYLSPQWVAYTGIAEASLRGFGWLEQIHPAERQAIWAAWDAAMTDGSIFERDFRMCQADGAYRWFKARAVPFRDLAGQIVKWFGTCTDIEVQKQAEAQLRMQAARLQVLADASRAFAEAGTDEQALLALIAQITNRQLGASCIIRMRSDDAQWLHVVTIYDPNPAVQERIENIIARVHVGSPYPAAVVMRTGQPLLVPRIDPVAMRAALSPELWPAFDRFHPHSAVITPLHVRGETIGSLAFWRHEREQPAFTEDDLTLAQDLADRAALAISSARLFGQAQAELAERQRAQAALEAERARLERLQIVAAALAPTRTRDDVLRAVIDASISTLGAQISIAAVVDPAGDLLTLTRGRGDSAVTLPAFGRMALDAPLPLADAIRRQELLWFESRAACLARYPQLAQHIDNDDDFALICVPFLLGDRSVGALALHLVPPRPTSAAELGFLKALAYQCAQALDRGLLYDAIRATTRAKDEALALLDTLFASAPVGLAFLDRELRYVRINAALAEMNGRPAAEHIGRRLADILPQLAPTVEPLYRAVLATGRPIVNREISMPAATAPGELRYWLDSYYPVAAPGAPPIGIGVIVVDITQMKRTSIALHETEQKLAALVNLLPIGISILDSQSKVIYANPTLERIRNMSSAQMFAGDYSTHQYIQPDGTRMPASTFASVRAAAEQREVHDIETGVVDDDGRVTWLNVSAVPVALANWNVVVVTADITERKRTDDALRDSRQQLIELSVRLVNAQEDERRSLAYELHDEIGQQLTGLNMVLESATNTSAALLRAKLHEAQQLVASLTGQVRQLSLDLRPPMLDDMGLLPTLLWHIQRYTQQTNVTVNFKYSGLAVALPPHVAIAAYRIVQEGLTNIARHAQTTTALVRVWINAGQLKITIEDQGCGFDVAGAPQIGRSIGLAGMRERAQLLGGQFDFDSTPGEGTRIRVTLPIDTVEAE